MTTPTAPKALSFAASRRRFLGGTAGAIGTVVTAGAAATIGLPVSLAEARSTGPLPTVFPIARRKVGGIEVTSISDGYLDLPYGIYTGLPEADIQRLFAGRGAARPNGVRFGFTVWLVNDGQSLTLIDTGVAGYVGPTAGRLQQALGAIGVGPGDIDAIAITHAHMDHIGGLVRDGRAVFPNAELHLPRADVAYFTDPAERARATDLTRTSFDATAAVVSAYPRAQRIDGRRSITRGIETVDLAGHTPGHTGYRIADGGESLLIVGDALFDPALHPGRTDLGIAFEADPAAAKAMRDRLFPMAAGDGSLLAATHMPFPGVGRIAREGRGLVWQPADWDYAA